MQITHIDFLRALERWPAYAQRYWWDDPQRPDLGCFGTGYNSWGVQTNQKFLGAYAVLAADPELDEQAVGCSREALLDRALRALRFSLASHVSGDHHCADGARWGHTWISGLGIERMMHGVDAIAAHLTDADRDGLRRMLCSEAEALLSLPVQATRWAREGGNKPESNIWNGAILARAALRYPDAARAADWMERAHRFFLNGISVASDALEEREIAGRPLREWHVGANFFPNYALDHHGYLNVGYMVICLSNIAMFHYGCRLAGQTPPESLYHHAADLWAVVRRLIFADGRLMRVGGDSRQRYCYCQDYLLPTLFFCADYFADAHAPALEAGALDLIRQEQECNGDGGFLSRRLRTIQEMSPYYYTRLESDKAVVLSMNALWRRLRALPAAQAAVEYEASVAGSWEEPEHGVVLHRSPRRAASWSWRAREAPQGLCVPPSSGHRSEWCANMGGSVRLLGEQGARSVVRHQQWSFPGGFLTVGEMQDNAKAVLAEGWNTSGQAPHQYAVAALPDERTMLVLEYCRVGIRAYLSEVKGLKLNVANDLFNGGRRVYYSAAGAITAPGEAQGTTDLGAAWANVEDVVGVVGLYGAPTICLFQAGRRRASEVGDSLYYDELCFPCRTDVHDVPAGSVVLDCGSAVLSGAARAETEAFAREGVRVLFGEGEGVRAVQIRGADGAWYLLAANFGEASGACRVQAVASAEDLVTGAAVSGEGDGLAVTLAPGAATLLRLPV